MILNLFSANSREIIERVRSGGITPITHKARLDVVLPLVLDDYMEDFATEASRAEFKVLLAQPRRPVCLRTRRIEDDRGDPTGRVELRREAYANVGQYVVDHCDVPVALWDGEPSRGRGGTAEIVQYARKQNRPILRVWQDGFQVLDRQANNGLDATALDAIDRFNCHPVTAERR